MVEHDYIFYTVISTDKPNYKDAKKTFLAKFGDKTKCVVIKELGKNRDHPHLNILWKKGSFDKLNSLYRAMRRLYEKKDYYTKHLVRNQPTYHLEGLFNYCTKEDDYKILVTDGNIEDIIIKLTAKGGEKAKFQKRFKLHLTNEQIVDYLYRFAENRLGIGMESLARLGFRAMIHEGYFVSPQQYRNSLYYAQLVHCQNPELVEISIKAEDKIAGLNFL